MITKMKEYYKVIESANQYDQGKNKGDSEK